MHFHSAEAKPERKRIIVCADGTWQSSASETKNIPSNVTRLARSLACAGKDEEGRAVQQVVFYDAGIGTGAIDKLQSQWQGGIGGGLSLNVIEAYNFIALNYNPGDEIFAFGFSRGAYTARSVAGLVTDIGVLNRRQLPMLPQLYDAYKSNKEDGIEFTKSKAYRRFRNGIDIKNENFNGLEKPEKLEEFEGHDKAQLRDTRKVKVIGVWDTVGALGIPILPDITWIQSHLTPEEHAFHNVRFSDHIEHGFQALALDEHRKYFSPTLWFIPNGSAHHADDGDSNEVPHLLQVWFPGVHINCGGGSKDLLGDKKGDLEQISNITFAWMLEQVSPFLAFEHEAFKQDLADHEKLLQTISKQRLPQTWGEWIRNWGREEVRYRNVPHGWATGPIIDSLTTSFKILGGSLHRTPKEHKNVEGKLLTSLGDTCEYMHPCVAYRDEQVDADSKDFYDPVPLQSWKDGKPPTTQQLRNASVRNAQKKKGGFFYTKTDAMGNTLEIPEYKIRPATEEQFNFERMAAEGGGEAVAEFLKFRDEVNF